MPDRKVSRKRKELDVTDEFSNGIRKNFQCGTIRLKKLFNINKNHSNFYYLTQNPNTNMVFVDGVAGTAKTYLAVYGALELLKDNHVDQIIYIRTVVESSSRSIGALPGELDDKFSPYSMPLLDKLNEILNISDSRCLLDNNYIKAIPVNFTRGLTFNNSAVILDECFEDTVYVETDKGRIRLKKILKNPNDYKVLSFNENLKIFEYKNILNTFKRGKKSISELTLDGRARIRSTKNHKFLTTGGWKAMEDLKLGDGIISSSNNKHSKKQLNEDQQQFVIGSILGDGSLQQINPNSFRIKCIHSIKQKEYLQFKSNLMNCNKINNIDKNGYSQLPALAFNSGVFFLPTTHTDRKKYAINNLTDQSLSISWQDDGYYNPKRNLGFLFSCADNEELNNLLAQKLNSMGYKCVSEKTKNGKGREYYQIRFNVDGFDKMCSSISQYVHPSMSYKIPEKYRHLIGNYEWNNKFENYSIRIVSELNFDIYENEVYDIEVEDNHNFVVSNIKNGGGTKVVAHNCQNMTKAEITTILTRFGKGSKYFVCGDTNQSDIKDSGFKYIFDKFDTPHSVKNDIHCVRFDNEDIVRSPILKHITQVLNV